MNLKFFNSAIVALSIAGVFASDPIDGMSQLQAKQAARAFRANAVVSDALQPLGITALRNDGGTLKAKFNAGVEQTLEQCVRDYAAAHAGGGGHAVVIPHDALNALGITGLREDGGTLKATHGGGEKTLEQCIRDLIAAETAKVTVNPDALAAEGLTLFNVQAGVPKVTRAKAIGGGTEEVDLVDHIRGLRTAAQPQVLPAAFMASVQHYIALTSSAKTKAFIIAQMKAYVATLPGGDIVDQTNLVGGTALKTKEELATLLETGLGNLAVGRFLVVDPVALTFSSLNKFIEDQKTFLSGDLEPILIGVIKKGGTRIDKSFLVAPVATTAKGLRDNLLAAIFA